MCYIGRGVDACTKKVAEEDIPVFKLVNKSTKLGVFNAMYYDFSYEIGKEYKTEMEVSYARNFQRIEVRYGFHSYIQDTNLVVLKVMVEEGKEYVYLSIGDASFAHIMENSYFRMDCVIPKGSSYYINDNGEVVSNRIKVLSVTKLEATGT